MAFGFDEQGVSRIQEAVRRTLGGPAVGSQRRRQPPVLSGGDATIKILGPCASYTPAVELADSDFDVDFGGDCDGPSRFGLVVKNLDTNITSIINMEHVGGLVYESASFSWNCAASTKTLTTDLVFAGLDVDDVTLTFYEAASPIATYVNSIYRFFPLVGGYLQVQTSPCDCVTLPYDACIAPPTR
jgi:hypothetical protein